MMPREMKRIAIFLLSVLVILQLVACKKSENKGEELTKAEEASQEEQAFDIPKDYYPVTIKTGDSEVVVKKMPEKAIVFNYDIAEMLSALGLADKIYAFKGGHQSLDAILPEYKEALKNLKETEMLGGNGFPTLENMLNLEPDLVIMPSYYFNVDVFGKKEDYAKHNIPVYVTEGTYIPNCTIENTYNDLMNIGKIFNKEKEAAELVESMRSRIAAVQEKMKGKEALKVMAFDCELNGKVVSWGGSGLANSLLELAGGKNVFANVDKQFPHVTWEEVIAANPDLIVIDAYEDDDGGKAKVELLKNNPQTAELDAVKNNRFLIIPLFSIFPSIQNVNAVEAMSEALLNIQK